MVGVTDPSDAGTAGERDLPSTFDAYAAATAGTGTEPRFSEWLRARAEPDWTAATTHRFTRALATGELEDAVFRRYLEQDYVFVETLTGTVGHAVGAAPTMAAKARLVEFLGTLTAEENDYFARAFDALGAPAPEDASPERTPTTEALLDLFERAAGTGGYLETLAVLAPAEWIYLEWATAAAEQGPPEQWYFQEWVDLHATEEFASFVGWLREQLDREGPAAAPRRQRRAARLFERTATLEVAFFETAYGPSGAGDPP